jgi:hypothetical protein
MPQLLKARPVSVQVKQRGVFAPPMYDLFKVDVSVELASRLAAAYRLQSTNLIVNQNAASTQYLSFRHFLPGEPFRFFDVRIGIDETEIVFSNPATVVELNSEVGKVWRLIVDTLHPVIKSNYLEATLHCETDGWSVKAFMDNLVSVQLSIPEAHKGFSVTTKGIDIVAKMTLDVSESVRDGLYVVFAYLSTEIIRELASFEKVFDAMLNSYRGLQSATGIQLLEPT